MNMEKSMADLQELITKLENFKEKSIIAEERLKQEMSIIHDLDCETLEDARRLQDELPATIKKLLKTFESKFNKLHKKYPSLFE